jgi:Holliday junction resolvase-like predicted endonuclease
MQAISTRASSKKRATFLPGKIGRWWGNNPHAKRQEEIDILTCRKDSALFGECKWTNTPVDVDILAALTRKSSLFHYKKTGLWLFSKTRFTDRLVRKAGEQNNVWLVGFEDILL